MSVEQNGYLLRHNTYTIHPLDTANPTTLSDELELRITSEQTGLNIFLQREAEGEATHVYLCADSRVVRRIVLSSAAPLDLVNMELLPPPEVMIERQDLVPDSFTTNNLVLPTISS